jgi:hypothetical protein
MARSTSSVVVLPSCAMHPAIQIHCCEHSDFGVVPLRYPCHPAPYTQQHTHVPAGFGVALYSSEVPQQEQQQHHAPRPGLCCGCRWLGVLFLPL